MWIKLLVWGKYECNFFKWFSIDAILTCLSK